VAFVGPCNFQSVRKASAGLLSLALLTGACGSSTKAPTSSTNAPAQQSASAAQDFSSAYSVVKEAYVQLRTALRGAATIAAGAAALAPFIPAAQHYETVLGTIAWPPADSSDAERYIDDVAAVIGDLRAEKIQTRFTYAAWRAELSTAEEAEGTAGNVLRDDLGMATEPVANG